MYKYGTSNQYAPSIPLRGHVKGGGETPEFEFVSHAETAFAVRMTFAMRGHQQIEIYSKRGTEADFTLLRVDTNKPYLDGHPPQVAGTPETRRYRARYKADHLPVGDWSDTISVTAQA